MPSRRPRKYFFINSYLLSTIFGLVLEAMMG